MSQIAHERCRCCLAPDRMMVSIYTDSTHNDHKTLYDYLNTLFNYDERHYGVYPKQICLRCSKALQITYHFMLMSLESKVKLEESFPRKCTGSIKDTENRTDMLFDINKYEGETSYGNYEGEEMQVMKDMGNPIEEEKNEHAEEMKTATETKIKVLLDSNKYNEETTYEQCEGREMEIVKGIEKPLEEDKDRHAKEIKTETGKKSNVLLDVNKYNEKTTYERCEGREMENGKDIGNPLKEDKDRHANEIKTEAGHNDMFEICEVKCDKDLRALNCESNSEDNVKKEEPDEKKHFCCRYCGSSFIRHEKLIEHTQSVHKQMIPFKCKECSFHTCFIESLLKHYKKQHQVIDLEKRLYETKELLTVSAEREPTFEITFKCNQCDFQTHNQTELDEHLSLQHDIEEDKDLFATKWYNCPSCYHQFKNKTSFKIHFTMAHNAQTGVMNVNVHNCEHCGKSFDRKTSLLAHERHCAPQDPVKCNFCQLDFSSVYKYEKHLQTEHSVEVKHECEICHKNFKTSSYLAVHRKRHNNRYNQCNLCPKNYINNAELEVHRRRIHSRVWHKVCSICGKSFEHLHSLREHKKIEHRKSIQCKYCEYTSNSKFAMEVHQYRHTGRPYKCKHCAKQYVLRKALREHSKKVHGFDIAEEDLAAMFIAKHGYPSRFDAFSQRNNNLQIDEIDEMDVAIELKEFNLTFEDIIRDLFSHKVE